MTASHFDDNTAYASVSRFRVDDLHPYIFRTHDGGKSWQPIVHGMPEDAPVNTVREDPVRKGLLFAGTEKAVWVSLNDGALWQPLQLNLPHASMRDLWIHNDDLVVATHGRSFWILDDITALRQITADFAQSSVRLCKPATAWRIQRDTNTDTPLPPDEPAGKNPPEAAIIHYYLRQTAHSPVTLEILDAQGRLVRRYSSVDPAGPTPETLDKSASIPLYWIRHHQVLPATAGMHRWVWDLHYTGPVAIQREYPISAIPFDTPHLPVGPTALPGRYMVRLTAAGETHSEPLLVKMDPRVKTPRTELKRQFQTEQDLASMIARSSQAVGLARFLQTQTAKLADDKRNPVASQAKTLDTRVKNLLEPAHKEVEETGLEDINKQVSSLYGQITRVDAAPTPSQLAALGRLETALADALKVWTRIQGADLPAFNAQLRASGLEEIHPEWNPETQPDSENEE